MSEILFAVCFGLFFLTLVLSVWYLRFIKASNKAQDFTDSHIDTTSTYRARLGNDSPMGQLRLSKDSVRFDTKGICMFEVPARSIRSVIYNKRSFQFFLNNGQTYIFRYLHPSVEQEGLIGYWSHHEVMYNDPDTLRALVAQLRLMDVEVSEGSTGPESSHYYISIVSLVGGICFMAVMALVIYIF